MRVTRQYRNQRPGATRWKKTHHHMQADFAREWFAKFEPGAIYEPLEHSGTVMP